MDAPEPPTAYGTRSLHIPYSYPLTLIVLYVWATRTSLLRAVRTGGAGHRPGGTTVPSPGSGDAVRTTGQRAKEVQRRARATRQRADAHGIFDPAVNRLRASSACLCELHRSASAEEVREMRRNAWHELVLGLPFEDEAALKVTLTLTLTLALALT